MLCNYHNIIKNTGLCLKEMNYIEGEIARLWTSRVSDLMENCLYPINKIWNMMAHIFKNA